MLDSPPFAKVCTSGRAIRFSLSQLAGLLLFVAPLWCDRISAEPAAQAQELSFDIPSQPLASALESYSNVSGRDALYNTNLAAGRRSNTVAGTMSADAALDRLLKGTGLSPRYLADRSFVLLPSEGGIAVASTPAMVDRYYARIQARLREALCINDDVRSGRHRIVAMLWIDAAGMVERHERLDGSVMPDTRDAIDEALAHLSIGEAPPAGLNQPVTIAVVPMAKGVTMRCEPQLRDSARSGAPHE